MANVGKLVKQAQEHFEPGESVVQAIAGTYETKILNADSVRSGAFIATDRRLVFYAKKMFGYDMEVFPYSNISSVEMGKGFMGHTITFYATGNKVSMKWIQDTNVAEFVNEVKSRMGKKNDAPNTSSSGGNDIIAQIEKLAKLKEQGILTDEEFDIKKKELLAKM